MADSEQTQFTTRAGTIDLLVGERLHCLELLLGDDVEQRYIVGPLGLKIGRTPPADVVLAESEVSRAHCMVVLKGDELHVADLNSTNGTFIDGVRVTEARMLPVGSVLQVGNRGFKHEWRMRSEIQQSNEFDRELEKAASYVKALLPPAIKQGPIRVDWVYRPSARLGGDAFGYGQIDDDRYVAYLIDVAGHGAGSAMHAVAVMNQLRQRSLPNTDMANPAQVLGTLNALFQMEAHDGLYFTIWYGVYDARSRTLDFASGGHHAAYLIPADRSAAHPLQVRNVMIGAMPGMNFRQDQVVVPPGATVYLFSDGVYEIIDKAGKQWNINDVVELILDLGAEPDGVPRRLHDAVRQRAVPSTMDDDFSLMAVTFD